MALRLQGAAGRAGHPVPASATTAASEVDPGTALGGVPAPDFTLIDQFGHAIRLSQFRGKVVVLAFIDSRCTTYCPLTAEYLRLAQEMLGGSARQVQLLAVDANPGAIGVGNVKSWSDAHGMTRHWIFATGALSRLERVWQSYHVGAGVIRGQVDHTPAVYLIDQRGGERRVFLTSGDASIGVIIGEAKTIAGQIVRLLPGRPHLRRCATSGWGAARFARQRAPRPPSPCRRSHRGVRGRRSLPARVGGRSWSISSPPGVMRAGKT